MNRSSTRKSQPDRMTLKNTSAVGIVSQLAANSATNTIPIKRIVLPDSQPRKYFAPEKMQQLVESIKTEGILQPLLVRPVGNRFELVAGERRYRAAQVVGLKEVPAVVREMSDEQAQHYALVENLQREDLNPVEETEGILQLLEVRLHKDREEVIALLNKLSKVNRGLADNVIRPEDEQVINDVFNSVGRVTPESFRVNRLPLLNLPADILEPLLSGKIEYTKAKAIAQVKEEDARQQLLESVIAQGLSVSAIRERVKLWKEELSDFLPEADELRTRLGKLNRLSKKSEALEDPKLRQKLDRLLLQIEKLLKTE
jgi:ParB family chromosome partitioning protein